MEDATTRIGLRFSRPWAQRRLSLAVAIAAALVLWPQPGRTQVAPFYDEASRAGAEAYDRGDFETAIERFRIAGFGMLDEPQRLADTLTRLALAQAAAGRRDEFLATFERISQTEELFNAYSRSPLAPDLRAQFEERVAQLVPASTLERSAAFAKLHRRQELQRLENMLPAARKAALEQLVAGHPDDPSWQLMLASARVQDGSGADAIAVLEGMVSEQPTSQRLACLLGRAYLQSARCEAVVDAPLETVHRCDVRTLPTDELVNYVECLADGEHWLEAASVLVSLPPERRASRPFPKLEKRVARRIDPSLEVTMLPPFEIEPEVSPQLSPASTQSPADLHDAAPRALPTQPAPPVAELENLRRQLTEARTVTELQAVAAAAAELNRQHPQAASEAMALAGEAAYRASKWQLAVNYLRAAGGPPDERHDLLFYLSVSLYELGDLDAARRTLSRALPGLENTALVERYRRAILDSIE